MRRESILAPTPFGGVFKPPPPFFFLLSCEKLLWVTGFFTRWRNMDLALTSAGVVFVHHAYSWITQSYKKTITSLFYFHHPRCTRCQIYKRTVCVWWKLGKYSRINIVIHNDSLRQVRPRCSEVQLAEKNLHIQPLFIIFFAYNIWPEWPRDIVVSVSLSFGFLSETNFKLH